ncbi:MAG: M2 family metallopeptidase [Ignavibacteriales bacterium]|nr:M2 family metallopeptidase [Ignavibacteriales bacterium]MBK7981154.1 M2 family metallopeptidase [Ignavibacteriota bacterium]
MEKEFFDFIKSFENKVVNLSKELSLANFNATISGKPEDYVKTAQLELKLKKIFSNKEDFEKIKEFKNSAEFTDGVNIREIEVLYNSYASYQIDEELLTKTVELSNKIEQKFATYRAEVDGKKLTDNEIDKILEKSKNSEELEETWKASKQIGKLVNEDIIKLVKLRNEAATNLGFKNYHQMSLKLNELEPEFLDDLFDKLDALTDKKFKEIKNDIDNYLSNYFSINKTELMPWHYQDKFFQQGPSIYNIDYDKYFENKNIEEITDEYYSGIGMDIKDMLSKSDLYEKEGKYQHAYCTQIDKEGDIRVLCNIKPNYKWMSTMLHEFGHAVYDKYVSKSLPWVLREHAHIFTTEAIAMLFGRFASNPNWLREMIGISENEKNEISNKSFKTLQLEQIIFSRWVQVIYRFEKAMFENPDCDLNSLWWQLVEKYQGLKKPENRNEADWASKIHIALYPVYYQNYMLGELLASQLYFFIKEKVLINNSSENISFVGKQEVGEYLINLFFSYGALYKWDKLVKNSTGEELNPNYWIKQFVN